MDVPLTLALIGGLGTGEVLFILLIIMLLFGASKIPELARSLGKAQKEFQKARDEIEREANKPAARPVAGGAAPAPTYAPPDDTDDARILRQAREMGISTDDKTLGEVRAEVERRREEHAPKE